MDSNKSSTGSKSGSDKIDPEKLLAFPPIRIDSALLEVAKGFSAYTLGMASLCPHGAIFVFYLRKEGFERFMYAILGCAITNIFLKVDTPDSLPLGGETKGYLPADNGSPRHVSARLRPGSAARYQKGFEA